MSKLFKVFPSAIVLFTFGFSSTVSNNYNYNPSVRLLRIC